MEVDRKAQLELQRVDRVPERLCNERLIEPPRLDRRVVSRVENLLLLLRGKLTIVLVVRIPLPQFELNLILEQLVDHAPAVRDDDGRVNGEDECDCEEQGSLCEMPHNPHSVEQR
ncbi:MAG: hypothetical protein E6J98_06610 [Methanobacteriota archaeon]|nr:MAG: hypothetical protein E6J98_06610 [Euryarchaeota archaeon]